MGTLCRYWGRIQCDLPGPSCPGKNGPPPLKVNDSVPLQDAVDIRRSCSLPMGKKLTVPCRIAERYLVHEVVVATITESALLGMDLLQKHQAAWNWKWENYTISPRRMPSAPVSRTTLPLAKSERITT